MDLVTLREELGKPLLPRWITQELRVPVLPEDSKNHHVICCTASRRILGAEASEGGYIQGAGDDSEGWSYGLTPSIFWQNSKELKSTCERDLPDLIEQLVKLANQCLQRTDLVRVKPTDLLYIGSRASIDNSVGGAFNCTIICGGTIPTSGSASSTPQTDDMANHLMLYLECGSGKIGSRALRTELSRLQPCINSMSRQVRPPTMLVVCETGSDLSVGVVLAILCLYFNDDSKSYPLKYTLTSFRLSWVKYI